MKLFKTRYFAERHVAIVHEGKKIIKHKPYPKTSDGTEINSSIDPLNLDNFPCFICSEGFSYKCDLNKHIATAHGGKKIPISFYMRSNKMQESEDSGLNVEENSKSNKTIGASEKCPTCQQKNCDLKNSCVIYAEFLTKVDCGYQCKLCLRELPQRSYMGNHIREKHNLELREKILAESHKTNFDVKKTMTVEKPQITSDEKKINYPQVTMVHMLDMNHTKRLVMARK